MGHTIFLLTALAAAALAGPIQEVTVQEQCARQCTVSSQFNYETGKRYEFTYETELRTSIQGASEDHAGVHLAATVHLDFLSKCEMVMRLSDVKMSEHDPETSAMTPVTSGLIQELESTPLTASFQDGRIEELCLSRPENEKILNIKRGILSLIQNNIEDINKDQTVTETDVSGECQTDYSSSDKGWYNKLIKKSKNLLGCKGRQSSNTAIQGTTYLSNSDFQSLPLIKSTHNCEQEISKATGRLQSAVCREQHSFAPFSREGSGATTLSSQTLTFVKEQKSRVKPEMISTRVPLSFQPTSTSADVTRKDMERKLVDICDATINGVTQETPALFSSLVYTMKSMASDDLISVLQKIQNKEICSNNNERVRKFFLDAIPMSGTVETLKLMVQLLTRDQVSGIEADMWMTTLAFIQKPTLDMISEVKPLLAMKTNQDKAMLSVSSMVHSVCRNNPNCDNYLEVKKVISLLEGKIAPSCKISEDAFQTSLLALRAIGNAGFGTSAIPTLEKCIQRAENPIEIRLSAVEAFRRIPCKADKSSILSVFTNVEEDSEIRIAAYKSLMACPTDELLATVKTALKREEVNQVGSYIWSHLTNLMETSDPHKQAVRAILEDETLLKEFDMDKRKFSRNYEKSIFIDRLNTGATAEGDLIWSSKSFIPRSAMVNLTVDLFGNAINLFEVGGRVEGLEYFLESYFGPNGYFSDKEVNEVSEETAIDVVKADKVKRIERRNYRGMDDLRGSLYMKVFGNELRYMHFQGLDSLVSNNNFNFLDLLMNANKDNDFQYTHSSIFMDSSVIVPTSAGFTLNLTCNGTVSVDMKASGKMDVLKLTSSPSSLDINGIIRPSAALVVSSIMGIDALDTQVGIKMVQTLHSSTSVQGKISLAEGSILNVEFDLPDEKQDIFSVSSAFYTIHRHSQREQKMITNNRQDYSICSGSKIAKITGLELCGELSFPNASMVENAPYFPLTGPVKAGITLYKRDSQMSGYKFEARSTHNSDENVVRVAFSTPNSKVDRSFGFDLSLNKAQGFMGASLTSPWKKAAFKGTFVNERSNKGISGKLNWDETVTLDVKANLQSENSGAGMVYTPTVQIIVPGMPAIGLAGLVKYSPWKNFESEITLNGLRSAPIIIKSSLMNKEKMMSASASFSVSPKQIYAIESSMQTTDYKKKVTYKPQVTITSPQQELLAFGGSFTNIYGQNLEMDIVLDKIVEKPIRLKTNLITKSYKRGREQKIAKIDLRSEMADIKMINKFDNRNGKTLATDIDLTYVIRRVARDNIKLVTKIVNLSSKSLTKARASMNFASKRFPDYNMKLISNINHNQRHSELEADIAYGADFKVSDRQISVSIAVDRAFKSWSDVQASIDGKLLVGNDIRIITKLQHSHQPKTLDSSAMIRVNKDAMESSLTIKNKSEKLQNYFGQFKFEIPGRSVDISQSLTENSPNDFTSTLDARLGKYKNSFITTWNKPSNSALKIAFDINIHAMDKILIDGEYNFSPEMYKVACALQKASDKYSAISTAQVTTGESIQITTELNCPTRRVVSSVEATKTGNKYSSRADIRWNADRDDTQRITFNGNGQVNSFGNVAGSMTVQFPNRTIAINIRNSVNNKYATYFDLQWEPTKMISFDTTFGSYKKAEGQEIIGTIKIGTPYDSMKSFEMSFNHQISSDSYQTTIDADLSQKHSISGTLTAKKPISFRNIDVNLIAKAPSLGYKSIEGQIQHKIGNGVISVSKLQWNRQAIQIDVSIANRSDAIANDYKGHIDIKTSFGSLKAATVTLSHRNDGRRLDTSALIEYNKKQIGFQSSLTSKFEGWNVNTNGNITLLLPSDRIQATWDHRNTGYDISTTSEIQWNNKRVFVKLNGLHDLRISSGKLSAALQVQTPFSALQDVIFQINHLHKTGTIDSTIRISNNGNNIANIEGKYLRENGKVTSKFTSATPVGTVSAILNADYGSSPVTSHLELSLTPIQTISIDGLFDRRTDGYIFTNLTITLPNTPSIILSATKLVKKAEVTADVSVQYNNGDIIRLQNVFQTGPNKRMKLIFRSPFTSEYSAECTMQTSSRSLRASASIEAEPYLRRWSMSSEFEYGNGITGNIKISTPSPEVPYRQLSFSSKVIDSTRQSSLSFELQPSKIIQVSNTFTYSSILDMQISAEMQSPFNWMNYFSVVFTNKGSTSDFSNYAAIEYPRGEKMSAESKFSTLNGIRASVKFQSPYSSDLSAAISHQGTLGNFSCHGDFTWGKTVSADLTHEGTFEKFVSSAKLSSKDFTYGGDIKFNLRPTLTTEISLSWPVPNFEKVHLSHSFEGQAKQFNTRAEVSTSGFGTFSTEIDVDIDTVISLKATAKTPIKSFKDLSVDFRHEGNSGRFLTHAEYKQGVSSYSGDVKFSTDPAINFDATLKTPFKTINIARLSFSVEGKVDNFKLHAEAQLNKETSELDLVSNVQKKWNIDLTLRSPYTNTIKGSFDHWGSWKKFQSTLIVRSGKDKLTSTIKFAVNPTFNAAFIIKSPFAILKNQQLQLKHAGNMNSFKCNMQYKCNGKTYIGDASFQNLNALKAEMNLKGPTFRPINVAVSHEGPLANFKSSLAMSSGKSEIKLDGNFNAVNGVKGSIKLATPFEGFEMFGCSVTHSGFARNFKTQGDLTFNRQTGKFEISVDLTKDLSASILISPPFKGYNDITASVKHTGTMNNFNTLAQLTTDRKSLEGQLTFKSAPLSGSAMLRSTFPTIDNYDISFRHEGTLERFNANGQMNFGSKRSAIDLSFDSTNGIDGKLNIDTPYFKKTHIEMTHYSSENSISTDAFVAQNDERVFGVHSDLKTNPLSGKISVRTPFNDYKTVELSMHHEGSLKQFMSDATLDLSGKIFASKITYTGLPDVQATLTIRTPLSEDTETTFRYEGQLDNFNSQISFRYGKVNQLQVETTLNFEGPYSAELKVISPLMKNLEASFSHSGNMFDFNSEAQVTYAGEQSRGGISFKTQPDFESTISVISPIVKDIQIRLSHTGPLTNCRTDGSISYGGKQQLSIQGQFKYVNNLDGQFQIESTIPGIERFSTKFSHTGDLSSFRCHGEMALGDETASGDIKYSPADASFILSTPFMVGNIEGSYTFQRNYGNIRLSAPFMKVITGDYMINDNILNSESSAKFQYGSTNIVSLSGHMDYPISGELSIQTPLSGFKDTRLTWTRSGDFGGNAALYVSGIKHEGSVIINNGKTMSAIAKINSPLVPKMSTNVDFSGNLKNFRSNVDLVFDEMKNSLGVELSTSKILKGSLTIQSPLISGVTISFNTNKDLTNLDSSLKMIRGMTTIFDIHATTELSVRKAVSFSFVTPENIISVAGSFEGTSSDFTSHGEVSFNKQTFESDVKFTLSPLKSDISLKTPSRDMQFIALYDGSLRNFNVKTSLRFDSENMDSEILFNIETAKEGRIRLNLPRYSSPIIAAFDLGQAGSNVRGHGEYSLGNDKTEIDVSFSRSPLRQSVSVKTPLNTIELNAAFDGTLTNFNIQSGYKINDKTGDFNAQFNIETAVKGTATVSVPDMEPFSASFEHSVRTGNIRSVFSVEQGNDVFFSVDFNGSRMPLAASISIKTPLEGYKTVTAHFRHDGQMTSFNNHAEIIIEGEKSQGDMSFNFGSKLEGSMSVSSPYISSISTGFGLTGNMQRFSTVYEFGYGNNKYSFNSSIDTTSGIDVSAFVNTPIEGYKSVTARLTHKGNFPDTDSFVQVKTGRRGLMTGSAKVSGFNAKVAFQSVFTPAVQATVENTGDINNFNSKAEIRYNGQPSSAVVTFKTIPSLSGLFSVTSPYMKPVSGAFDVKSVNDKISIHAEGKLNEDSIVSDISVERGPQKALSITVTTPFNGFEKTSVSANYMPYFKGFSAAADAEYQGMKIESQAKLAWQDAMTGSISVHSPFQMMKRFNADITVNGVFPNIYSNFRLNNNGQEYSFDGDLKQIGGKISFKTPIVGFEDISAEISKEGALNDMRALAKITYLSGKEIVATLQNTMNDNHLESKISLSTPYTQDLSFDLTVSGKSTDFTSIVSTSMGENSAILSSAFKLGVTSLELDMSLQTTITGQSQEQKLSFSYDGQLPNMKFSTNAKILETYFATDASLQIADVISGTFSLNTPVPYLRDVAFSFEHSGDMKRFSSKSELQIDTGKKIEGSIQYTKYGWRRLQSTVEVRTPFTGYERTKLSYRHTASVDSFECDVDVSAMDKDLSGNLRASLSPMTASISISTPFAGYEEIGADGKVSYGSGLFNAETNVQFMRGKTISFSTDITLNSSPKTISLKMTTPFQGYEISELSMSASGDLTNFQSAASLSSSYMPSVRSRASLQFSSFQNFDGSAIFESQITNFEKLTLNVKNEGMRGKYNSKLEASWSPTKTITLQGIVTDTRNLMSSDFTLTTPFELARQISSRCEFETRGTIFSYKSILQYNRKTVSDFEGNVDFADRKTASVLMRAPITGIINVEGKMDRKYEFVVAMSQDISDINKGLKVNGVFDPESQTFSAEYRCPVKTISVDGTISAVNPGLKLSIDSLRYGIDVTHLSNSGKVKIILPTRSLLFSGSSLSGTTEGSIMWDADRDENKKISFRAVLTPSKDSTKAAIMLMMPSSGQEVQIESQVRLNSGRIIFDGKTELTYSRDISKKFIIMSRLEDISSDRSSKNYSFTFGVSHPYTSVDVQVASQFGKSNEKLTGGVSMKYLTVTRDIKTFAVNGQIDRTRKSFSFGMDTPMKKIGIDGSAQTESPYRLAVSNKYDDKLPLNTIVSFDPAKRTMSFQMNYDLDNPGSEFHVSAKYVNSSAISAEVFHVVNRQRITDVLMAVRLNRSDLLHSRLHWRPEMINDLKTLSDRKFVGYQRKFRNFAEISSSGIQSEYRGKIQLIGRSFSEEIKPVTDQLRSMYNSNEYYVRDATDAVVAVLKQAQVKLEDISEIAEEYLSALKKEMEDRLASCIMNHREKIQDVLASLDETRGFITLTTSDLYNNYAAHAYNLSRPVLLTVNDRYNTYVQYMQQMSSSHMANTADLANSAIYGARDYINAGIASMMARDDVKIAKSVSDRVYQQGYNAYKAWEIRENTEMVAKAVADWIKQEIEKELSDLKATVLNIMKSEVTVYDIKNGEIQMEFHLPIPLKSLDVVPTVDITPYVTKAKKYMPQLPSISLPSSDITTWLPPFDATASIKGNTITTFDGLTYDLDSSCTFILARDFVDSNFSLILHKEDSNKTFIIASQGQTIKIFTNGKVTVNDLQTELPTVVNGITVTSLDGHVTVNVADHVEVDYDKIQDTYNIKMNGYYFSKIGGILGSYDNEPSNDMMTSFGKGSDSVDRFAKTWEISTERCR